MKISTGNKKTLKKMNELLENENFVQEYKSIWKAGSRNKHKELFELTRKYKLDIDPLVLHDIYLNRDFSHEYWQRIDVCRVNDDYDEYYNEMFNYVFKKIPVVKITYKRKYYEIYPVSVGISPLASQREVIEFVKKNWKDIRNKLDKYGKQTKYKDRKKKERDAFIYENRNLPIGALQDEVDRRFGNENQKIGYEQIHTIINTEKKRRTKK